MQRRIIKALVIAAAAMALWETIVRLDLVSQIILAAPSHIVLAAAQDGGVFLRAFATTSIEIGAAIMIAWTLGIVLGVVAGSSHTLAAATAPVLSSIFAIPLIILYPLLMAWLGIGPLSKVVFGVVSGFFPIALNTIDGVRAIERRYLVFARSIGATRFQTYARIIFPLALPAMISGLRVGTGLVVIGVIVTEMLASLAHRPIHFRSCADALLPCLCIDFTKRRLRRFRSVVFVERGSVQPWSFVSPQGVQRVIPTGVFRTSDLEQMRMGVLEHLGIAQAPAWLFAAELREGTVVRLLAPFERTVPILAVRPASRRMPTKIRIFIEHLEKTFALCSQFNPRPG